MSQDKVSNGEMVKIFKEFGFDVSDYEILYYDDPWLTKVTRWLFSEWRSKSFMLILWMFVFTRNLTYAFTIHTICMQNS